MKTGKIIAVIPARAGSVRVPHKNIRSFNNTCLLVIKIRTLKKVKYIDEIIVNSDCDKILKIAKKEGVKVVKRSPEFATSLTNGNDFISCLVNNIDGEHFLYASCMSPFLKSSTYDKMINIYLNSNYDSVLSSKKIIEYMWLNNKSINYNVNNSPNSQDLPVIYGLTFGMCLLPVKLAKQLKYFVGNNPYFFEVTELESFDIDTQYDFDVAELIAKNN